MAPRSTFAVILVLATFALPAAYATGEEVVAAIDDGLDLAEATAAETLDTIRAVADVQLGSEADDTDEAAPREEAPPAEEEQAAPEEDDGYHSVSYGGPLGATSTLSGATRMLPLPVTTIGAAPRLDLSALTTIAPLGPLAPAPDAARAPAYAPVRPAAAPEPQPLSQPQPALEPLPLALAFATAATATAPAAATFAWERLRRFAWIALLYSRIAKERLLDHSARERLLDTIRAQPGLSVADLAVATGAPRNTVTYHLRVLEREGLVSSARNGRARLFFAPGSLEKREQADALGALRHETSLAMARAIGAEPGVDQKALCARVGVSPSLAHWHADRLVASGLVDKRREGRFVRYYPGAAFDLVSARSA